MTESELRASAQLFSRLLLEEPGAELLQDLNRPAVREALAAVGIEVPAPSESEMLAADFCAHFLYPEGGAPPIQSLWTEGEYEGAPARVVRELATHAGFEFDREVARGAAPDHLGSILWLWSEVVETAPEVARRIEEQHLGWCERALAHVARSDGFYGQVARATTAFVESLVTGNGAEAEV